MTVKKIFIAPIRGYQYISKMLPANCRYYPTCSEYAAWQLQFNGLHRALVASTLRILRCNQLFTGGIDYPVVKFTPPEISALHTSNPNYGTIKVIFWLVPKHQYRHSVARYFYVIKDFNALPKHRDTP
ncbi:MAG: membrane protein insertion efficiency factor YidD [Sulfurovum sp.]|nr:membrane protein insertion efficiency factor YidD [Sulfurovum sp.]MCB4744552.1 membrane protein insertion efficiency factor YidD [Sulfurovum sp.]MCB4746260.1 membrane protein insertion efficiency factor YidD [Sulfurovum sp.]MCB4747058.1 membrane protein insertion efficiency factor YidD [Sulfurovum sp.]MCB4749348.1 membrane protein insertion efficiency factor YidD [Sulfurovum sp.]